MYPEEANDATLIAAVRRGDTAAYAGLYRRHLAAAKRAAACLVSSQAEREDLVAEAFTRVLHTLLAGSGPREEFRPYLLVTMRHLAINVGRRRCTPFADVPEAILQARDAEPAADHAHDRAAHAFAGLPERWRTVLWHTEIEGESPAEIAPLLGLTANGVAALAYRAREGLRRAYLHQHLPTGNRRDCRATRDKLAGWVRHSITDRQQRRVDDHLRQCPRCRDLAEGLARVNGELRAVLAPIVLGAPFAAAYLTTVSVAAPAGIVAVSWLAGVKASVAATAAQAGAAAAIAAVTTVTAVTVVASGPAGGAGAASTGTESGEGARVSFVNSPREAGRPTKSTVEPAAPEKGKDSEKAKERQPEKADEKEPKKSPKTTQERIPPTGRGTRATPAVPAPAVSAPGPGPR
ncbi:sigma-70 family RNA polymerase sigma factor [Actinophytocola sp.]|uniref:sigma-70 family RNA polymerase sigma factor n=1 Tax=Actinophytocola sp. TaxID=1872138 RepID=UPI002D7F0E5D|nr:sigma-70 family RNA polymerase sigma factor [Actinophytocola sp.]HET9137970.1 sigma-70 family RNA polymerase sigma factor [Actinophytocola sp.]